MGRAEKLRMHVVYHEGSCGKSHIFKGKKKKSAHKGLRITAGQCEPGTPESAGCQGHLHFLKAEFSVINPTNGIFALDGDTNGRTHVCHKSWHFAQ